VPYGDADLLNALSAFPTVVNEMPNLNAQPPASLSLEVPVDQLLLRGRPLPPHEEMVMDDLTEDEGAAFLASIAE
jgi:hypothetical protein